MKRTIIAILLILPFALMAQNSSYILNGKVGNFTAPAKMYLLYYNASKNTVIDSSNLKNGQFEFKGNLSNPVHANLILNHTGSGMRNPTNESFDLYLEPGEIRITSPDSLAKAKIKGGKSNVDIENLKLALQPTTKKIAALTSEYYAMPEEKRKDTSFMAKIQKSSNEINDEQNKVRLQFIEANPDSYVSLDALKTYGGAIPDYKIVAPLFHRLSAKMQNSDAGREYAAGLGKSKATDIGAMAPEFTQNNTEGKPIKLSDFRGKYLLVDFWASWCGPCRAENPNVVKAYTKYHPKGFEILGVSLDNEKAKDAWLKAIEKDGLLWTQVSDLKAWNNEVAQLYGIKAIPQNVLIDPSGKIIGKNLRGEDLNSKLAEIFQ